MTALPSSPVAPAAVPLMYASIFLLQAAPSASFLPTIGLYAVLAAIFYFVLFRPQQQQRKQHDAAVRAIKRGDQIVTAGGIVGEVVHIREAKTGEPSADDHVTIRSGESRLVVERGKIAKTATRGTTTTSAPASSAGASAS